MARVSNEIAARNNVEKGVGEPQGRKTTSQHARLSLVKTGERPCLGVFGAMMVVVACSDGHPKTMVAVVAKDAIGSIVARRLLDGGRILEAR